MSKNPKDEFIASLKKSGVVEKDRLKEWLAVTDAETPKELARNLVRDEMLTRWQAKYLMSGRSRLDIGSYRLLERTSRDELGDRFTAIHNSLQRKVDLQVLPPEVTKDKDRCSSFLKKASLVAKLDHPNLLHVYDIDQEGGRYYLVTEHVEGTPLDQVPRKKITEPKIASILKQALDGVQFAHENDVVHGRISQSDLILIDDELIKIQNLAVSPLRNSVETESEIGTAGDIRAVKMVVASLLKEIPESARSDRYRELCKLLNALNSKDSKSVAATSLALNDWIGTEATAEPSGIDLATDDPFAFAANDGGFSAPIATVGPARKKKKAAPKKDEEPQPVAAKPGLIGGLWQKNPVAVIATTAVLFLLAAGGGGFGVYNYMNQRPGSASQLNNDSTSSAPDRKTPVKTEIDFNDPDAMAKLINSKVPGKGGDSKNKANASGNNPGKSKGSQNNKRVAKKAEPNKSNGDDRFGVELTSGTSITFFATDVDSGIAHYTVNGGAQKNTGLVKANGRYELLVEGLTAGDSVDYFLTYEPAGRRAVDSKWTNVVVSSKGKPKDGKVAETKPGKTNDNKMTEVATTVPGGSKEPIPDDLTRISGIAEKTMSQLVKGDVTTFKQMAGMSGQEMRAALKKGGKLRPNSLQDCEHWIKQAKEFTGDKTPIKESAVAATTKSNPTNPKTKTTTKPVTPGGWVEKFPRLTELPPVTNLKEKKIADITISKSYLLGVEMLCVPRAVSKTKLIFVANRAPDDDQKWMVGVKRREKEDPTEIATFRKSENAFHFQWLAEAANSKYAEYLRNCHLKLLTPDGESTFLALRKPIEVRDLRLTSASMSNSLEFDIPAMPNIENVVVEVLPMRVKDQELRTAVAVIEKQSPGRIMLKKNDARGFMWIQITGELKSGLKLSSRVLTLVQNRSVPIRDLNELNSFIATLQQAENQAKVLNDAKQNQPVRGNDAKKKEINAEKEQIKKFYEKAKSFRVKAEEYKKILAATMNSPISIRVYAKFGNLQTQLVRTNPKIPQPEGKKKKKK